LPGVPGIGEEFGHQRAFFLPLPCANAGGRPEVRPPRSQPPKLLNAVIRAAHSAGRRSKRSGTHPPGGQLQGSQSSPWLCHSRHQQPDQSCSMHLRMPFNLQRPMTTSATKHTPLQHPFQLNVRDRHKGTVLAASDQIAGPSGLSESLGEHRNQDVRDGHGTHGPALANKLESICFRETVGSVYPQRRQAGKAGRRPPWV